MAEEYRTRLCQIPCSTVVSFRQVSLITEQGIPRIVPKLTDGRPRITGRPQLQALAPVWQHLAFRLIEARRPFEHYKGLTSQPQRRQMTSQVGLEGLSEVLEMVRDDLALNSQHSNLPKSFEL